MNLSIFKPKAPAASNAPVETPAPAGESLEDVLMQLAKWGSPRVGQYSSDGTWHCHVEVNVTPVGVKFEAKSDFKQPTPLAAALQCRANLLAAVKAIGGAA
jgi:hypothetical protein